jgi:selenocysteine lyase/cysteine desulfurase
MQSRRAFLGTVAAPAAAFAAATLFDPGRLRAVVNELAAHPGTPDEVAGDEDFWFEVQRAFTVDRSIVNFNTGGVSPAPAVVQEAMKRHLDFTNQAPSYTMWRILEPQRETVRERLARFFGCDGEEIALTRNASEGLEICQLGFDFEPGDEIVTTTQAYPRMVTTFEQRVRREGIALRRFEIPIPAEDTAEVVRLYEENVTPRTRLVLMSHMINITGQILPVREVVAAMRARNIPVVVDGAHTFAHFPFTRSDLGCDYYATSLHKWLFAPIGTGMLYVKRDRIADLWPMMAAPETLADDIRKFEEIGTHPAANHLAIAEALSFHEGIGPERKAARLVALRDRWAKRLVEHESGRVRLHTSLEPGRACGIATVQIGGIDSGDLARHLWDEHKIFVVAIHHPEFEGIRVSPSVYSTLEEVDRFSEAMERVAERGVAAG